MGKRVYTEEQIAARRAKQKEYDLSRAEKRSQNRLNSPDYEENLVRERGRWQKRMSDPLIKEAYNSSQRLKQKQPERKEWLKLYNEKNKTKLQTYQHEWYLQKSNAEPIKYMLKAAQRRARKGGYSCTITEEDIHIPTHCPSCKCELVKATGKAQPNSPSLDKIVPSLGYVPGNVIVICWRENIIKHNATLEELEVLVKYLRKLLRKPGVKKAA